MSNVVEVDFGKQPEPQPEEQGQRIQLVLLPPQRQTTGDVVFQIIAGLACGIVIFGFLFS